jgi:cytochrome c peroxidase
VRRHHLLLGALATAVLVGTAGLLARSDARPGGGAWTEAELRTIGGLSLASLPPLPADPSNTVADDPRAVRLGHALFFDAGLSVDGTVACATCHDPQRAFTDGLALSRGVGEVPRASMTVVGTAYAPWFFWDGRKDSAWSQALGPLESPVEHGFDRVSVARHVALRYRQPFEELFGPLPDLLDAGRFPPAAAPVADPVLHGAWQAMRPEDQEAVTGVFVGVGKALAAYQRLLLPGVARFDAFADRLLASGPAAARGLLDDDEIAGLRLFIGRANCVDCHNGPLFTNQAFHNTGVPARPGLPHDAGRAAGARAVLGDEFTCLGRWSDAPPEACGELRFLRIDDHAFERAFKVPTLRGVAEAGPFMHAGQFATLAEVIEHYDRAPAATSGHTELAPLRLGERERRQLEAFLRTLVAPVDAPDEFLAPPLDPALQAVGP